MKKVLLLALCLLLAASLAACALPSGEAETTPVTTPITTTPATTPMTTTQLATTPATTPPATSPPETSPATSPPIVVDFPITEAALQKALTLRRPGCTIQEIVETDAGYFLFSTTPRYFCPPQHECARDVDFVDKKTGILAPNEYIHHRKRIARENLWLDITGYFLVNESQMHIYSHERGAAYGHRHFPLFYQVSYADGALQWNPKRFERTMFFPLEVNDFYTGWIDAAEYVMFSHMYARQSDFAVMFDIVNPNLPKDYFPIPRTHFQYDGEKRQMTLFFPNIPMHSDHAGEIPVSENHMYVQAARSEAVNNGFRVVLTLKENAELYFASAQEYKDTQENIYGVLFSIDFTFRESTTYYNLHVFDDITWICQEK